MKILLTGAPRSGKSTIIRSLVGVSQGAFWVLAERVFDDAGVYTGFKATTSTGLTGVFDQVGPDKTDDPIGHHKVDVAAVDHLYSEPISKAVDDGYTTIIIDEIGRLQRLSPRFSEAVDRVLASDATVLATINQGDDWTAEYTGRSNVITITLTDDNREELTGALNALLSSQRMYQSLPPVQQSKVYQLARAYAAAGQVSSLRKLFQNTLIYLAEHRYEPTTAGMYEVKGLTRVHQVFVNDGVWSCDCDLANGRGKFAGRPGECSHIQTIKVSQAI